MSRRAATESLQGVPPALYRTALYSRDEHDQPVRRSSGIPVKVRAGLSGTYTTAHAGSVMGPTIDDRANRYRAAGLQPIDVRALELRAEGVTIASIAVLLSGGGVQITVVALRKRLQRAQARLEALDGAVGGLGR